MAPISEVPGRSSFVGAYAIVRSDPPQILLAEDADAISRALAIYVVAQLPAADVTSPARLREMREALLEERWADALVEWIEETGAVVDVYDEPTKVWTTAELDLERASLEIRLAPLFGE
ncbi:MAG TPA: hypothetical protein VG318_04750 [Actinomycetota bacterium]|nr:hypothetical protein [Actinomycetota bacterium]